MSIEQGPDYRDTNGRWDTLAELQDIRLKSLLQAAIECDIPVEKIEQLALLFETNFIKNSVAAASRETGIDGLPIPMDDNI